MRWHRPLWLALLCLGWSNGCNQPGLPRNHAHYTVGDAWQGDGTWFYPAERTSYAATGLAVVDAWPTGVARETADGEIYDPSSLTGSHQTLQLPVILQVRNLENGREILIRINDRGPVSSGRLLSVSPHAARLLKMDPRAATRVSVTLDQDMSEGVLADLDGAPPPEIVAAPVAAIQEEQLTPPSGAKSRTHSEGREYPPARAPSRPSSSPGPAGLALPERVTQTWADPGRLWIDAGQFSQPGYAAMLAARLGAQVRRLGLGRTSIYQVRVGPFNQVPDADAALDRVRSAGVTGGLIVVE